VYFYLRRMSKLCSLRNSSGFLSFWTYYLHLLVSIGFSSFISSYFSRFNVSNDLTMVSAYSSISITLFVSLSLDMKTAFFSLREVISLAIFISYTISNSSLIIYMNRISYVHLYSCKRQDTYSYFESYYSLSSR
jgi:hypothetical protein